MKILVVTTGVLFWNGFSNHRPWPWQGSGVTAFVPMLLPPLSSCRSTGRALIGTTKPGVTDPPRRCGRCRPTCLDGHRPKFQDIRGGNKVKKESQQDGNNDADDDDGSFDVYSRDMRDQIRIESSEYRVIDGGDDNDGNGSRLRTLLGGTLGRMRRAFSRPPQPGKLILLRCGQSVWNANGTFTGWAVS
jgi:hypothetical protein